MVNYLLLRNNKESGPYTLDDLVRLGLKAYDLVWVQGKSAAWRYPSEVEELRPFAPAVEEQPFDRFYKKETEQKKEETPRQEVPVVAPEHEKYIPKKSVFVTMPGQQKVVETKPIPPKPAIKEENIAPVQQTIIVSENPAAAQIKYSQPLDEIKEMYVKTLNDRKQRIARKSFWLQSLKKAAVIFSLIALGVITGLILKSNGGKKQVAVQTSAGLQSGKTEAPVSEPDTNNSAKITVLAAPTGGFLNKEALEQKDAAERKQPVDIPANGSMSKQITPNSTNSTNNELKNGLVARGVDVDPVTGERRRNMRSTNETGENPANNNTSNRTERSNTPELAGLVTVASNEYKRVAFGGIRDLQLTVTNDSKFILENVTVELKYLKPSEESLRTENIQFKSVGPKATSTIRIPDTNRGIKVVFRITNIKARQAEDGVAGN